jgi:exodeoxyribonuclease V alpha subunit
VSETTEELSGEIAAVVFANPENGFGVVEVADAEHDGARAAGPLAALVPGQAVRLVGRWVDHPRHGPTFEADFYEAARPRSTDGLVAFLASSRFKGVGDALARRLVTAFGMDLPAVIEQSPERLTAVHGISARLAANLHTGWVEAGVLADLVQRLAGAGVPARVAHLVHRVFGDDVLAVLDDDPYRLLAITGFRWGHAEALARDAGIGPHDDRRLAAGAAAALREANAGGGHVTLDSARLHQEAQRLLGVDAVDARRGMDLAVERDLLGIDGDDWYTPADLRAERGLAADLARLLAARSRVAATASGFEPDPALTDEQASAVRTALTTPVSVLTGGPGTGKTRTVVEVVRACTDAGLNVALCAPTGRAAKRMEEVTGHAATTVHRLLGAAPASGGGFQFTYGAHRQLPYDLVVADEWSMADLHLARALAAAVSGGAHLLLVGDADQLPSVGAGAVLRDLLTDDAPVPATRLTQIHRQAAASRIVTLAHEINAGEVAPPRGRMGDVFAVPERSGQVAARVAEIVAVRAPAYFDCAPSDVQVLAPMYRGPAGVDQLNRTLKERLNPAGGRRAVAGFHEGDRVVQTRNDPELDVANGDIGEVVATDPAAGALEVAFPTGVVTYEADRAGDLNPAWCLTVHKSQGGEWPVVVLVLDRGHRAMLWRELVYTAVTRAAAGLLLVGDPEIIPAAARRSGSGARERRTRLTERLVRACTKPAATG